MEKEVSPGRNIKGPGNKAGDFEFTYTNILGQLCSAVLPTDKAFEGKICLFPSKLHHQVFPFYSSDEYRISISGNVFSDTSEPS